MFKEIYEFLGDLHIFNDFFKNKRFPRAFTYFFM